jgi:hypothetical protein
MQEAVRRQTVTKDNKEILVMEENVTVKAIKITERLQQLRVNDMKEQTIIALCLALGMAMTLTPGLAYASHGTDKASCEGDGLYDGKNNPFSQELYEMCGDTYYDAFIDGCMSAEGNTRDVCESATD